MTLNELPIGESAVITAVGGEGALRRHLLDMGLTPRTRVLLGLSLYTGGGGAAGLFDQIGLVLVMRALVGVGVGILMPLSTGLLTDYFPPEKQASLLGISSAMNQLGGVIATLLAGLLAGISWRASFLVYLLGLGSILLCLRFLPKGGIPRQAPTAQAADTPAPAGCGPSSSMSWPCSCSCPPSSSTPPTLP